VEAESVVDSTETCRMGSSGAPFVVPFNFAGASTIQVSITIPLKIGIIIYGLLSTMGHRGSAAPNLSGSQLACGRRKPLRSPPSCVLNVWPAFEEFALQKHTTA
jgi:hypothetical protein